jgi:hypothetical protein
MHLGGYKSDILQGAAPLVYQPSPDQLKCSRRSSGVYRKYYKQTCTGSPETNSAPLYPPRREGEKVLRSSSRLYTGGPLAIQLLNRLVKFFIKVADHVIKGDVLLPLGLKVVLVLNEPRVDFFTHLDYLHTPPLWIPSRCFRSVPSLRLP